MSSSMRFRPIGLHSFSHPNAVCHLDQNDGQICPQRPRTSPGCGATSSPSSGGRVRASDTGSASSSAYLPFVFRSPILDLIHSSRNSVCVQDEGARVRAGARVRVRARGPAVGHHGEGDDRDAAAAAECAGAGLADAVVHQAV